MKEVLCSFFMAVASDPRIGPSHVSLFCAMLQMAKGEQLEVVEFRRSELMLAAKINSDRTYQKCMRDMVECGYLKYTPSYDHRKLNRVLLM